MPIFEAYEDYMQSLRDKADKAVKDLHADWTRTVDTASLTFALGDRLLDLIERVADRHDVVVAEVRRIIGKGGIPKSGPERKKYIAYRKRAMQLYSVHSKLVDMFKKLSSGAMSDDEVVKHMRGYLKRIEKFGVPVFTPAFHNKIGRTIFAHGYTVRDVHGGADVFVHPLPGTTHVKDIAGTGAIAKTYMPKALVPTKHTPGIIFPMFSGPQEDPAHALHHELIHAANFLRARRKAPGGGRDGGPAWVYPKLGGNTPSSKYDPGILSNPEVLAYAGSGFYTIARILKSLGYSRKAVERALKKKDMANYFSWLVWHKKPWKSEKIPSDRRKALMREAKSAIMDIGILETSIAKLKKLETAKRWAEKDKHSASRIRRDVKSIERRVRRIGYAAVRQVYGSS